MNEFINNLEKEIEKKLKKIESADLNIMKKSLEASQVLANAFQQVKEFIGSYTFKDEAEEIQFFKEIGYQSLQHKTFGFRALLPFRFDAFGFNLLFARTY